jgi:hypothetical protein
MLQGKTLGDPPHFLRDLIMHHFRKAPAFVARADSSKGRASPAE